MGIIIWGGLRREGVGVREKVDSLYNDLVLLSPFWCECWFDGNGFSSEATTPIQLRVALTSLFLIQEPHKTISFTDPLFILYYFRKEGKGGSESQGRDWNKRKREEERVGIGRGGEDHANKFMN